MIDESKEDYDVLKPIFPIMETEKAKASIQKRAMSRSEGDCFTRKESKSYSEVVQAWFETLSAAIGDGMNNNGYDSTTEGASPQRTRTSRRNAFILHMTDKAEQGNEEGVSENLESPPALVWEVIDSLFISETESLLVEPLIVLPKEE